MVSDGSPAYQGPKRVSIHQPVYFPWLGFFHKLNLSQVYIILDDCQAIKQSWMNRVQVASTNGRYWLSVPLNFKFSEGVQVKDLRVSYEESWIKKHLKSVHHTYSKTPYFEEIYVIFSEILEKRHPFLMDLNLECLDRLLPLLGPKDLEIHFSSKLQVGNFASTRRLVELIKAVEGDTYICGLGSAGYLEEDMFKEHGLNLHYQKYEVIPYTQKNTKNFEGGLSVIDTWCNLGASGVKELMEKNNLKNHFTDTKTTESSLEQAHV